MATTPTAEPARVVAGDTLKFSKALADYPASQGWVLSYALVNAGNRYTFNAAAEGDGHLATVAAATTAGWAPGEYALRGTVSKAGEVYTVTEARLTVAPAYGSATDTRSLARQQLENVELQLTGRSTSAVASYEIAGRKLAYIPMTELLALRDRLRMDVMREDNAARAAAGLPSVGRIQVRFGR